MALLASSERSRSTILSSREVRSPKDLIRKIRPGLPGDGNPSSPRNRPVRDFTGEILPTVHSVMTVPAVLPRRSEKRTGRRIPVAAPAPARQSPARFAREGNHSCKRNQTISDEIWFPPQQQAIGLTAFPLQPLLPLRKCHAAAPAPRSLRRGEPESGVKRGPQRTLTAKQIPHRNPRSRYPHSPKYHI